MENLLLVFYFIFGAIIGSFLNVLVLRWNSGRTLGGRSYCMTCNVTLRWYNLIPVISFLAQSGKCSRCDAKISPQYIVVELVTALSASVIFSTGITAGSIILFAIACLLISIVVYDIRHTIIPDEWVYLFIALSLLFKLAEVGSISGYINWFSSIDFVAGPIFFLFFASFWYFSKGRWMGLGDGKLALGLGWLLGMSFGITALMFAFWMGAIWGLISLFVSKKSLTMKSEIPFAPFLVLGAVVVAIFQVSFLAFL